MVEIPIAGVSFDLATLLAIGGVVFGAYRYVLVLRAEIDQMKKMVEAGLDSLEKRFDMFRKETEQRLSKLEGVYDRLDARFDELALKMTEAVTEIKTVLDRHLGGH